MSLFDSICEVMEELKTDYAKKEFDEICQYLNQVESENVELRAIADTLKKVLVLNSGHKITRPGGGEAYINLVIEVVKNG